jgi:hypothetical protein
MMSQTTHRKRWLLEIALAATLIAGALVASTAPASAHVPAPVWRSPGVTVEIPDVPIALAAVGIAVADERSIWTVDAAGVVATHGDATHHGDLADTPPDAPIVGIEAMPTGLGYWLAGSNGAVYNFGDAPDIGDVSHLTLDEPIVTIARTSTGQGFWLAAGDGGMFSLGDAQFFGSAAIYDLVSPIVAMSPKTDDTGYWLAAGDGGIFAFGGAEFFGSMGGIPLDQPVVSMAAVADDAGYWLAAGDGGLFTFGTATFDGSAVGQVSGTVTDMAVVNEADYVFAVDGGAAAIPVAPVGDDAQNYYDSLTQAQIDIWDDMAQCESGQRWDINTGNGYYGGLQFSAGSWAAVGGSGLAHQHSRIEQIYRGALLQERQGWGAWPGCSSRLGLI